MSIYCGILCSTLRSFLWKVLLISFTLLHFTINFQSVQRQELRSNNEIVSISTVHLPTGTVNANKATICSSTSVQISQEASTDRCHLLLGNQAKLASPSRRTLEEEKKTMISSFQWHTELISLWHRPPMTTCTLTSGLRPSLAVASRLSPSPLSLLFILH